MSIAVELRQRRAGLVTQARALLDGVEAEKRSALTAEERTRYDAIDAEISGLTDRIEKEERVVAAEAEVSRVVTQRVTHEIQHATQADDPKAKRMAEFRSYLKGELTLPEMRALQAGSATAGGYLLPPEEFRMSLIKAVDNMTFMRKVCKVDTLTTSESIGYPSLDADPADPTWTTELAIGSADSTMSFGKREMKPHPLAQFVKVSEKLLRLKPDAEALVRDRLAYKIAVVEENAFLNGSGAGQPHGIFTASDDGITTSRDYSTGNTASAIVADNLIGQCFNLKEQYRRPASWCFSRAAMRMIRQLKDGNGQYLWLPGLGSAEQDRVLDKPVFVSEYCPSTFQTGLYVGILGDFKQYWIVDSLAFTLKRLEELYAETGQIGFISRLECDGAPVLAEAFTRVKLG